MGTVVGAWRLRLMIFLIVLLTSVYLINGFFYSIETDEAGFIIDETELEYDQKDVGVQKSQGILDVMFGIGAYLTFGNITNVYARIFINLFTTICFLCIGYITYTFVKEWVPFN